ADSRCYTFYLRKNSCWSNGDPVTANDFVYAYKRILNPKLGAPYANMLYVIEGASDYHSGKDIQAQNLQVNALDDYTLQIRLVNPTPYFLSLLYLSYFSPLHPTSLEAHNAFSTPGTGWTRPGALISNGPFKLKSWIVNSKIIVERNPYYWNAPCVKLNEVHFHPVGDRTTEERMFNNGELHITDAVPENKIPHYRQIQSPYFYEYPTFSNVAYDINCTRPALKDPRVRLALSLAIDRNQLTNCVIQRSALPAFCLVPPGIPDYKSSTHLRFDVAQAKALLA
ncbi:MAG TPA: peptide ABC transporter substrate-binding protein, partial [Opitutales bacterium]|nr:peptide ABC transporter substrate-binding protein [Opitutales bacterium]